jgi:two-component system, OmpR family, response regulator VicR
MKILIVDDDRDLTELLGFVLHRAAFRVIVAHDPGTALGLLEAERPTLVLLDARIGSANGFDLLREIRRSYAVPVIMLTAMAREDDKLLAFQLGADDYVTKPFSHRELIARIHARLRGPRSASAAGDRLPSQVQLGSLNVNAQDYTAAKDGLALKLTATEFRLLHCLLAHAGSVVPTSTILKDLWGYDDPSVRDSLRVTVYRLRRKIEDDPRNPQFLQTIPGVGFVLKPDADQALESQSPLLGGAGNGMTERQDRSAKEARGPTRRGRTPRGLKRSSVRARSHPPTTDSASLERRAPSLV